VLDASLYLPTTLTSEPCTLNAKVVRVLDVSFYQSLCDLLAAKPPSFWHFYLKWNYLDPLIGHLGKDFQHVDLLFRQVC